MTIVQQTANLVRNDRYRRLAYFVLASLAGLLILFPRPWVARAKIVPQDTSASAASTTALIGALGGQASSIGSILSGGRPSNDLYLIIGRSDSVASDVIKTLKLVGPDRPFSSVDAAKRHLDRRVDVHLLLGGVMEIESKLFDPELAKDYTDAYAQSIGRHLAAFGKQLIQNKQRIVGQRFQDASNRVARSEAEMNRFRRANNLAEPEEQLGSALSQRASLEGNLQAKIVESQTLSQFRGPESSELQALQSDIAGLRAAIAQTAVPSMSAAGPNIAGLTAIQFRYLNLYRNLRFQQGLYDVYQRSAEQVAVEALAVESATYVQIIDPSNIDPDRQYNVWAIAAFAGILLLALFTEWYAPVTGLARDRIGRTTVVEQP